MDTTQEMCSWFMRPIEPGLQMQNRCMDIGTDIQINEAFWGFEVTLSSPAWELESKIPGSREKNWFDLSKCHGQRHDGDANVSGAYLGVQARIAENKPLSHYFHGAAHSLNIALNDSLECDTLETLRNIFRSLYQSTGFAQWVDGAREQRHTIKAPILPLAGPATMMPLFR